uniref:DNA replication ATP-dependent helicase/nuclease DNA2 n=1 Tax=Sinocyclocheilus grahami TaxID=75366 RepID=A0A672NBB4_SINGR
MSTVSGTNDFGLVMSYSSWIQNGSTEEKETFLNCPFTKKRPLSIPEHVILASGVHNRYWVLDVQDVTSSQSCTEKHLTITCSKTTQSREACILKDGWESTPVAVGDIVHLEGRCVSGLWTIDGDSGFLVLLPDLLISGTSIASSIRCMSLCVVFKQAFDGGSKQMLNGTIVHDIFQKAAMSSDFSPERIQAFTVCLVLALIRYSLKLTQADMRQEVEEYLPSLSEWAKHYVHTSPQAGQKQLTLKLPSDGALSKQDATCSMTVTDFVDIEENIWCPRFGLKGKIDVTAGVRIHRRGRRPTERIVPLELKTGKESNSIEHRSQVILYTLMSSARRCDPEAGFLVYLKTGSVHPVVGNHMDRRELVKIRNSLAHHIGNSLVKVDGRSQMAPLPAIVSDKQACKYCPQKRNCAVYNRDPVENCIENPQAFVQSESEHLSHVHLQYFSHWLLLCTLEALTMENKGGRRNIWLQTAQQREKSGGCVGNMQLDRDVSVLSDGVYKHSFVRKEGNQTLTGLIVGDRIVVSDQDSVLIGLATGYVTEITISGVTCSLDKNLSKFSSNTVFRLDQDEGAGGLSTHLGNLSMLIENTPSSERLRELIVEFRPPQFIDSLSSVLPRDAKDTVANILKGLNKPQKQAMKKVLLSKDYTLIVGMPGTGKTTTICTLVPAPETVEKNGISNHTEAILVQALVTLLLKAGCRASDIGVIAPYRQQLKAISSLLQGDAFKALEVNTVDKYQGRDKSIIIVSFVRSNPEGNISELLQDWRRLNVAITRAKHKLLMLGSAPTLRRYAPLEKLLCHLQQEDMISFTNYRYRLKISKCLFKLTFYCYMICKREWKR